MDEIVDIVDENDNIIGQELKSKCHANKILHRGAAILVFKDKSFKEILIQKRSMKKASNPGKLCIPGGHLSFGDNYLDAAKRELQEEEFYEQELPKKIKFKKLYKVKKFTDNDYEFHKVYRIIYPGPFYDNPDEVKSSNFIDINKLIKDINKNPKKYTGTTVLHIKEFQKRFLS